MPILTLAVPTAPETIPSTMPRFLDALGRAIGAAVVLLPVHSYAALAHAVDGGAADLVWAPPIVALDLVSWRSASVIAAVVRGGSTAYPSVLVTRRGGRVRDVADLVDARIAWVSRLSAAGFVVPSMHLESLGLPSSSFLGSQTFVRGHRAALEAVDEGRADVAACYARRLRHGAMSLPHEGSDFRVLAVAGWVPSDVVMASARVPVSLAAAIGAALSRMTREGIEPLSDFLDTERFAIADDAHLDDLRAMTTRARVGRVASEAPPSIAV